MDDKIASIRRQLVVLSRQKKSRTSEFQPGRPTEWQPTTVIDPQTGTPFTDVAAWEFVADELEKGAAIETVELAMPSGKIGYVVKIQLGQKHLYVKLQLGTGKVIGRSFHYSKNTKYLSKDAERD